MRMAEGRRDKDDGAGLVVLRHVGDARKALHIRKRQRKERGVERADHQARIAVATRTGGKRQHDDLLGRKPVERLLTELGELIAEAVLEARLVRGKIVADGHAVGVAAAHIVLHEVDDAAVLAAHDLRLLHRAVSLNGIDHVVTGGMRGAVGHFLQLLLRLGVGDALAFLQRCGDLRRQVKLLKILVIHHKYLHIINIPPPRSGGALYVRRQFIIVPQYRKD